MLESNKNDIHLQTIDLDLTNNCVLACDYCFRGARNQRRLSLQTAKDAIDWFIEKSQDRKKLSVALFGGEPLMEFELIKQIVPYAEEKAAPKGKSIHFTATTNCVLINDEIIDFFRKHKMSIHTSIDGGPESQDKHRHFPDGSGSSAVIEPNIKKVLRYWPNRTARMSVSNDLVYRWMEDVLYLAGLGYKNLSMVPIPEQDWTQEQFEIMAAQLRKISDYYIERYRQGNPIYMKHLNDAIKSIVRPKRRRFHCGSGRGYVLVKTDGSVYPCHRFGGDIDAQAEQHWKLGDIYNGWNGNKRDELLNFDCRKHIKADCENCMAVHMCATTCIAVSWSCFKDIYKPHPNQCRMTNMFYAEGMRVHYILQTENNQPFMREFYTERSSRKISDSQVRQSANKKAGEPEAIFVMLSNKVLSPCFMFNGDSEQKYLKLSLAQLKSTLKKAVQGNYSPDLMFLVDDFKKLDVSVSNFLESIPEQIILPLISRQRQKDLGIPFSENQTVIAPSLKVLSAEKESIHNRTVIAHVERDEISDLSDVLFSLKGLLSQLTLRLKDIHKLSEREIEAYKKELRIISDTLELKWILNVSDNLQIHNFNQDEKCPAGKQLITIGPDGMKYPCPAFFFAQIGHADLAESKHLNFSKYTQTCPGCEFMKVSGIQGLDKICDIYKTEKTFGSNQNQAV